MSTCNITGDFSIAQPERVLTSWLGLLEFEKTLFVVINLMDVAMTFNLINTGAFYESNPIAELVLSNWGMVGMLGFKLLLVAFVLSIANVVAIWKLETSRKMLIFGSFLVGSVVTYSVFLMMSFQELI